MKTPVFYYNGWKLAYLPDGLRVEYDFSSGQEFQFTHSVEFSGIQLADFDKQRVEQLIGHLGLVELLSYWKAFASPRIEASCVFLTEPQRAFWHDLYLKGMGEYFYKNKIDFTPVDFLQLITRSTPDSTPPHAPQAHASTATDKAEHRVLVPVGGGKDSAVTAEIIRNVFPINTFILNPTPAELAVSQQAGCEHPVITKRTFDPRLLELNKKGFLNGHVPFSASLAMMTVIAAELGGYTEIAVSNERSSNEANVTYLGHEINHQYSKSLEFETAFNSYISALSTVRYFSFMRPLYELQIAKLFSTFPQYFPIFRSCNRGQKTNSWCGACPKCLAITLTLLPWVGIDTINSIFGSNPLTRPENIPTVHELAGLTEAKPFECVTTKEETIVALHLCVQVYAQSGQALPVVLSDAQTNILATEKNLEERAQAVLDSWAANPNAPEPFEELLRAAYHESI